MKLVGELISQFSLITIKQKVLAIKPKPLFSRALKKVVNLMKVVNRGNYSSLVDYG